MTIDTIITHYQIEIFDLMGHSMGGYHSFIYTLKGQNSSKINNLILLSP